MFDSWRSIMLQCCHICSNMATSALCWQVLERGQGRLQQDTAVAAGHAVSGDSSQATSSHLAILQSHLPAMRLQAGSVVQRGCTGCGSGQEVLPASPVPGRQ